MTSKFLTSLLILMSTVSYAQHNHNSAPQLGAGYAFDHTGSLFMVSVSASSDLIIQRSSDLGKTWSNPKVLVIGEKISAEGENRPKLLIGPHGQFIVTYTKPLAKAYTGEIRYIYSKDGLTFSKPLTLQDDLQEITHRFDSIIFDSKGGLHAFWIDKRDAELARAQTGKRDSYEGAAIYRKFSKNGGVNWSSDIKVADHTCECCRIGLTALRDGRVAAMWRHVFPGNIRDHAMLLVNEESSEPIVRATYDEWHLEACPHHGPALAQDEGEFFATWFSESKGKTTVKYGKLNLTSLNDNYIDLPDDRAEHADIATVKNRVVIVWRSFDGKKTSLNSWVSTDRGVSFKKAIIAETHYENDYPRLVTHNENIYIIWRTEKNVYVQKSN